MAKLLFVVHGMGSHPPGWSDAIRDKLDAVASRYGAFRSPGARFSQRVRIEEIRYDGIFEEVVQQWARSADELAAFSTAQGRPLPKLVAWLKAPLPPDEKSFFWSTAIDPLLYRGFALVRDRVRSAVVAQVAGALTRNMVGGAVDASVLAHSLGTAVMHDALHELGRAPYQGNESFVAKRWQFGNLFMLADVCSLGPHALLDIDYQNSVVRPVSARGADGGYCKFFLNASHEWDPFVLAGPFKPKKWGKGYLPIGPLDHVRMANVHGYTHYLDHPAVHVPVINGALGDAVIGEKEWQDALAKYADIVSPECQAQIDTLKAKAQEFEHDADDLESLVIRTAEFFATAKRAAAACRGLASDDLLS